MKSLFALVVLSLLPAASILGQRVAIISPQKADQDADYTQRLSDSLRGQLKVLDRSQSEAALRSVQIRDVYNMSTEEARAAAAVMGCEYFVLVRNGTQRRSSFSRPDYYEAFAVHYVVSGRTGELVSWLLKSFEADEPNKAMSSVAASADSVSNEIVGRLRSTNASERRASQDLQIEDVPDPDSPSSKNLKPPIPYRRIKPEYTSTASLYDVRATIDIEADVDSDGRIMSTRILRWAGFGLEESVEKAVRSMNWRPAMRDGRPLPMRILLRYNFTKLDKE